MRFDSVEHVAAWKVSGEFPAIHKPIADLVVGKAKGRRILDLCCNHGLLAEQLMARLPDAFVVGVDEDVRALERGRQAGVRATLVRMRIDPSTYEDLRDLMRKHRIDVVVARRCLPEILGPVMWSAGDFAEAIREGGAVEVFLQGRVPTPKATSPLHTIARELAILSPHYAHGETFGQLAYLVDDRVEVGETAGSAHLLAGHHRQDPAPELGEESGDRPEASSPQRREDSASL